MRMMLCLSAAALLGACSVVPPEAWTYDPAHPPKASMPTEELAALNNRVADLQLRRDDIRTRIASESNVWARLGLYADLHNVGSELSPLERRLNGIASSR